MPDLLLYNLCGISYNTTDFDNRKGILMSAVMIVLLLMCAAGITFAEPGQFYKDYCSPRKSNALKGIFVLMVFVSHFRGYIATGESDRVALAVVNYLGQLMVVPFLFYSGYGVVESIRKKGVAYTKKLPVHRALKTLLHFDIAVLLYLGMNFILGNEVTLEKFLLSLVCWTSLGNSNWYIFAMVALYLITAVSFLIIRKNHYAAAALTTVLSCVLIVVLMPHRPGYCYNTILSYCLGMWYSLLREKIEKLVTRNDLLYFFALAAVFVAYRWVSHRIGISSWVFQVYAMLFMILVSFIGMKVNIDNGFLQFLGKHTFSIYILQRLPMWYFSRKGLYNGDPVAMFIVSFLLTCVISVAFDMAMPKLDAWIFRERKKDGAKPAAQ